MRYPHATWRGSPNVGGVPLRPARGFVFHVEQGSEAGTNICFENPNFQASSHFGFPKIGPPDQWVDTNDMAWAEVAGNPGWISGEFEGFDYEPMNDNQLYWAREVIYWLSHDPTGPLYLFPLQTCDHDGTGITTHAHYPSGAADPAWGGHPCPGSIRTLQVSQVLNSTGEDMPLSQDDINKVATATAISVNQNVVRPLLTEFWNNQFQPSLSVLQQENVAMKAEIDAIKAKLSA